MEKNIKREPTKVFKGKTEFTLTIIDPTTPKTLAKTTDQRESDKRERHFYQRMLRAYLRGAEYFNFGFHYDKVLRQRTQTQHKVLFAWE